MGTPVLKRRSDHDCYIDCKPTLMLNPADGKQVYVHVMYPAEPTDVAGRYQYDQNRKGMTRREWRESGQDESRNVREWNHRRKLWIEDTNATREKYKLPYEYTPMSGYRDLYRSYGVIAKNL